MNLTALLKKYTRPRYQRYGSLGALLLIAVWSFLMFNPDTASRVVLLSMLLCGALFDLRYRLIPNQLILFGMTVWIGVLPFQSIGWTESIGAAVVAGVFLLAVRWAGQFIYGKPGLGMGDIKLFLVIGLFLGWDAFWVLYLTVVFGGLFCMAAIASGIMNRRQSVPLAPFIAAAGITGLVVLPWNHVMGWLL